MKKSRRVQIACLELTKIKKRLGDRIKADRNLLNYPKSIIPKPNSFYTRKNAEFLTNPKSDSEGKPRIAQKFIQKIKGRIRRDVKLPTMRGNMIKFEDANFKLVKFKNEDNKSKPICYTNTNENRKQRRNLNTWDNQNINQTILYSEVQSKLLLDKENRVENEKKRMMSPFYKDKKLLGVESPQAPNTIIGNNQNLISPRK